MPQIELPHIAPNHMAIIMDGNRRWARRQGKPTQFGHDRGARIIDGIAHRAYERGVNWLTLFAFSSENWQRSQLELKGIMTVLEHYLKHEMQRFEENNIRFRVIGDLKGFSKNIIKLLDDTILKTAANTGLNLTVALGYGGQKDIITAAQKLAQKVKAGTILAEDIDEEALKNALYTTDLPSVDLLLRTGDELRISNFLLWDIAYAELSFSVDLWPDFSAEKLDECLNDYASRQRRFGGDNCSHDVQDNGMMTPNTSEGRG